MQTSQYIYNETPKTNFGIHDKAFLDREDISGLAKTALLYLLGKPKHWRLRINDIKKKLGCGTSKAYKVLAELRAKGFAVMVRGQQKVEWFFYAIPKPQPAETRANSQSVKVQRVEVCDDLNSIEKSERIEKPQQHTPEPKPITAPASAVDVVVHCEEIKVGDNPEPIPLIQAKCQTTTRDPAPTAIDDTQQAIAGIPDQHQPTARQALRTLTKEEADAVVAALTLALSKGAVTNPTGYLMQLIKATKNGSFSPVTSQQVTPAPTLDERLAKERQRQHEQQERGKMTVEEHAAWLQRTFGAKVSEDNKPAGRISLRQALGWN